jgi:hypothetical protein
MPAYTTSFQANKHDLRDVEFLIPKNNMIPSAPNSSKEATRKLSQAWEGYSLLGL